GFDDPAYGSGKKATFPTRPTWPARARNRDRKVRWAKAGNVRRRSTPTAHSIRTRKDARRSKRFARGADRHASFANASEAMKNRSAVGCPCASTSWSFTFAIIHGMSMSTGQISWHRPHETQRWAKDASSRPWTFAVQGMPIGPG